MQMSNLIEGYLIHVEERYKGSFFVIVDNMPRISHSTLLNKKSPLNKNKFFNLKAY